jgi:signal transduction histidine kinase
MTQSFLYLFLPFVVFIVSLALAALVLRSDWRSGRHRLFASFLMAMGLWGFTIFGMRSSPTLAIAYMWEEWAFIAIVFTSVLFYHFTVRFTRTRVDAWVLRSFYALALLVSVLSLTGFVATEMQRKFYGYAPVLGPAFPLYLIAAYVPVFSSIGVLLKARARTRDADERRRINYVLLGVFASLIGGTTDFLPSLGLTVYPMGIVMNIVFGGLTTVAILRYRLLELRSLLRNGFAYFIVSSVIFAGYGVIFLLFSLLFRNQRTDASVLSTVAALFLVTILLPPVIGRAQQFVDRLFFRERYDHLIALEQFTQETRDIADFAGLADSLIRTVTLAMQSSWVAILVPEAERDDFVVAAATPDSHAPQLAVRRRSSLARWLERNARALEILDLDVDPYLQAMGDGERRELQASGVQLFIPMQSKGQLTGVIALGPKLLGDDYSQEDIDLLTAFTSQAATIIENSRLYSQELARLKELEQLDKLKSNLLRTVSHEIKSPITAIKASVDLLSSDDGAMNEQARARLMRALQSGITRLEMLVEESLDYARMQSAQLELRLSPTDMGKIVDDVVGLLGSPIRAKNQDLHVDVQPDLPKLLIDAPRIERIVLNLVSNATKFTPNGGVINVRVYMENDEVRTEVSDTGPGISEDDRQFLFREFYRGSNADGQRNAGTGLGLAIAKYLVELHGGRIGLDSKLGEGTKFFFTLPFIPALAEEVEATAAPKAQSAAAS